MPKPQVHPGVFYFSENISCNQAAWLYIPRVIRSLDMQAAWYENSRMNDEITAAARRRILREHMSELGRAGGSQRSPAKTKSARQNIRLAWAAKKDQRQLNQK